MVLKLDGKYYFIQLNWNGHFLLLFSCCFLWVCIVCLTAFFHFNVLYKFFVAYSFKNRLTELDSVSTVNRQMEFPLAPFIAQPGKN